MFETKLCSENWDQINDAFGERGGVYRLIFKVGDNYQPIPRLLEKDPEGVLYIGKADSFLDRVIDLKKTIWPKYNSGAHIAGRRYKKNDRLKQRIPWDTLFVQLIPADDPKSEESQMIENYFNKFGEVPPLNAIE